MIKEKKMEEETKMKQDNINVSDYSQEEVNQIIKHFEILFDLNYALPNSKIQELEDGYVFYGKKNNVELNPKEAFNLLLEFKKIQNYE